MHIDEKLNRDKLLDEALFVGLCGLGMCRRNLRVTGLVRLEIAHAYLGRVIKQLKKDIYMDKEMFTERFVPNFILDTNKLIEYITELENTIKEQDDGVSDTIGNGDIVPINTT